MYTGYPQPLPKTVFSRVHGVRLLRYIISIFRFSVGAIVAVSLAWSLAVEKRPVEETNSFAAHPRTCFAFPQTENVPVTTKTNLKMTASLSTKTMVMMMMEVVLPVVKMMTMIIPSPVGIRMTKMTLNEMEQ